MKVLFVHARTSRFTDIDLEALRSAHEVRDLKMRPRPGAVLTAVRGALWADAVVGWFAGWHTLLPLLFARRSLLIIGGVDVAAMPEIGYGMQSGGWRRALARLAMRRATRLMTNSHYSQREAAENIGLDPARVTVVHHGIPDPFGELPGPPDEEPPVVLTVGVVDARNLERKGLRPFAEAAALAPELRWVLVGREEGATVPRSPNLELTGFVTDAELDAWMRRASVYVQASRHEGFGMSVAESMLAGAIPVVTRAGALPEVVGDTGIVIDDPEPEAVAAAVRRALALPPEARAAARERVLSEFPLSARREGLLRLVAELAR